MKRTLLLIAAALALLGPGAPAHAGDEVATGALAFEGHADLSAGTWNGRFSGELSGSYRGTPWSVEVVNPATAALSSVELVGCAAGTVTGRFRIKTNDYGQVFGAWVDNIVPRHIVAV